MKLPVWFEAPPAPPPVRSVRWGPRTTARGLTIRTITATPKHLVPAAVLASLHQAGEALVPFVVGRAVDEAVAASDGAALVRWILVLGATFLALSMSFRFGSRIGWLGMHSVQHELRMMVTDRLISPFGISGRRRSVGADLSVSTADTTILARSMGLGIYGPAMLAGILVCAGILLSVSWPLGLGVLVGSFLVLVLGDLLGGVLRGRVGAQQAAVADAAGSAADLVQGLRIIKGVGAQTVAAGRYTSLSQQARLRAVETAGAQQRSMAALSVVGGLFVVAVGAVAGWMALDGRLTVGELITVVMISQFVIEPITGVSRMISFFWNPGVAAAGRVLEVLRTHPAVQDPDEPTEVGPGPHGLRVRATWLPEGSLEVLPGEHVTLRADPTTTAALVSLLSRTREVEDEGEQAELLAPPGAGARSGAPGTDIPLAELPLRALRQTVLVAPHEPHLFAGSVIDNVLVTDVTAADLPDAVQVARPVLEAASVDDVARVLPDGLASPVGEAGAQLSGGQRQRVGLARVLHAADDILVLVDPTTGVDSVTEQRIAGAVHQLRHGKTTVVISGSPAWTGVADRTVDLSPAGPSS